MSERRTHGPNWLSLRVTTGRPGVQRGTQAYQGAHLIGEVKCGALPDIYPIDFVLDSNSPVTALVSRNVPYGTGECTSTGVSSANEARTACYVLYRVWRRWLHHEERKRSLLQKQRRTTLQRH